MHRHVCTSIDMYKHVCARKPRTREGKQSLGPRSPFAVRFLPALRLHGTPNISSVGYKTGSSVNDIVFPVSTLTGRIGRCRRQTLIKECPLRLVPLLVLCLEVMLSMLCKYQVKFMYKKAILALSFKNQNSYIGCLEKQNKLTSLLESYYLRLFALKH